MNKSLIGRGLVGRSIGEVTIKEFLASIDATLLLKPVKFGVKDTTTGQLTTYYIYRDRRPGEFPFPENKQ